MSRTRSWKQALLSIFVCGTIVSPALGETIVTEGDDAFRTGDGGASWTFEAGDPIPADFFGPGSDPFDGEVMFDGDAIDPAFGPADTIVRRLADTGDLDVSPQLVDIRMIALRFVSSNPITVTYNGGQDPEEWDVRACLSSSCPQCDGTMTITKTHIFGGTYVSNFSVIPKFTFIRTGDQQVAVLDLGDGGDCEGICTGRVGGALHLAPAADDFFWALLGGAGPTAAELGISTFGVVSLDSDCDGKVDFDTIGNDTTNFMGGVEWTAGRSAGQDYCKKTEYAESALANGTGGHTSYISNPTDSSGNGIPDVCDTGACCSKLLPDGCEVITAAACKVVGGRFAGYGTDCSACTVPAVSEWGVVAMVLLVLLAGTVVLNRRRRLAAHA